MTPSDLAPLLQTFHAERLALLRRHVASAAHIADYDVNNAYQYVIAREETHVYWVHRAVLDVGGTIAATAESDSSPAAHTGGKSGRDIAAADALANREFVTRWTPRVAAISHARHRKMLDVVLGEMQEHERLFAQAGEGRTDVIGVPLAGTVRVGAVLGTRWVE